MEVEILHKICLMTALVMGNLVPQNNLFEQVVFKKPLLKLLNTKVTENKKEVFELKNAFLLKSGLLPTKIYSTHL